MSLMFSPGSPRLVDPFNHTIPIPTGSAGVLRLRALVDHPTHHTAPVHLPSVPQRRDTRRDLEDHLQGTPGVSRCPNPDVYIGYIGCGSMKMHQTKT